jgi:glycine C-acetyltransferase
MTTQDTRAGTLQDEDERTFALGHNVAEWAMPEGRDLLGRTEPFHRWANARRRQGLVSYFRGVEDEPGVQATARLDGGRLVHGLNFASQDYLGLATDGRVREAGIQAIRDHGVHSASSGALQGGTRPARELEDEIADFVQAENVVLFPTGWGVGFGTITAMVRPADHIVMDHLAHACLQQGAHAATQNVHRFEHLDSDAGARLIADIRSRDPDAGILVVTEGTFSMDADCSRLPPLRGACREYGATLLVDVAHDLGELGPAGTGQIGIQGLLGEVDLVMGAFSKVFCSCGGFLASSSAAVKDYVRIFGGTFTFSNALSAQQAAVALEAIRIARSPEGDQLRAELQRAADTLRGAFAACDIQCYGDPCAIVAVPVGDETVARVASSLVADAGVLVNIVEFPAVAHGKARFRMQLMPGHTDEMLERAAAVVVDAIERARDSAGADRKGM